MADPFKSSAVIEVRIRGCTQVIASTMMSEPLSVAYMNRGIAYTEQHKPAKALADLGAAIDASKTNAAVYYNRGNVLSA